MGRMIRDATRVAVVAAAAIAILACVSAPSTLPSVSQFPPTDQGGPTPGVEVEPTQPVGVSTPAPDTPRPPEASASPARDALSEADGVLPARATVLDDKYPGVANLDPSLLEALREAANDAAEEGIVFRVNSGWRSRDYQNHLLREAIAEYGSEKEAARWVATADTSPHVSGDAVDIGLPKARKWLSEHGADYGLCQIYRNEPWHFELRIEAIEGGCPRMYANPTQDPRME